MFFTVEKIEKQLREIRESIHREAIDIPKFKYYEGECPGAQAPDYDDSAWGEFRVGDTWGGYDKVAWFRAWVPVPEAWREQKLALRFLVGPRDGGGSAAESLLYLNGSPLQGLDIWHEEAWLPPEALEAGRVFIAIKAWSGVLHVPERRRFKLARLVRIDENAERYYYLADTVLKSLKLLDENDLRRARLLELLNASYRCIDFMKPRSEAYYRSLGEAFHCLDSGLSRLQTREIKPRVVAVGHSHIDLAWLWRRSHTREKAARTFSTVLHLMRQYPEYRYVHSSPQLYRHLKEDYPEIYDQVRLKIASGEWEITGGMWVEADTNIPSGESLVRQFLLGKRFARQEFGVEMNVLWLPDVFGYSWALPQIIRKSGLKYFMTSKISWSQYNRFPYDTFYWRGIDGTEVLTHFVTTPEENSWHYTYNGLIQPADVKGIWDNYRQKDVNDELLLLYGWGDGGGGPTMEMLEAARALNNMPGLPEVELGNAGPYFERLERRLSGRELPVWDGELYLEYHRGTYTSQAANKRANRRAEVLYHDAEWLSALADTLTGRADYPAESLRDGWELILFNQFHDILPGSSIRQVYEDSQEDYRQVERIGEAAAAAARKALISELGAGPESLVVFNSLSWEREDLVEMPWSPELEGRSILNPDRGLSPAQVVEAGGEMKILFQAQAVPALGYRTYPLVQSQPGQAGQAAGSTQGSVPAPAGDGPRAGATVSQDASQQIASGWGAEFEEAAPGQAGPEDGIRITPDELENAYYHIRLNPQGQIVSVWDKRSARQVLAPQARGNVFQAFEDRPMHFDAWDVDIYYQEKMKEVDELVEAAVIEAGPLRGALRLTWHFGGSRITQQLRIYRDSPRIDFFTEVDWHEQQVLLKVAFPVAVRATRATYDIQFGNIERPTHWNTSWDYARFESVGHKWVDLSEGNYGVSLLNDCKYGHDVKNNVLRLTLIKSAVEPDPQADQGRHVFTYSLLPHSGGWREGNVVEEAYALNFPLQGETAPERQGGSLPPCYGFAQLDAGHVILETVKKAEAGEAWIVRVYEYKQCRSSAVHLRFGRPVRKAVEVNLVEEDERPVAYQGQELTFPIAPYEIKTFKVWF